MASIAIVGMACRYPDARSPRELWENVLAQRRSFRRMPAQRLRLEDYYSADRGAPDAIYSTEAALIEDYEFDRARFRVSGATFRATDIAHWMTLDVASQALADAGFADGDGLPRDSTRVIIANTLTGDQSRANVLRLRWPYVRRAVAAALEGPSGMDGAARREFLERLETIYKAPFPAIGEDSLAGGLSNTIAGRVCNYYDLKGGGYTVDGACASSLLAVAHAAAALADGEADAALAGGVDLSLDPFELVGFAKAGALAEREMRVYDRRSCGFWPGEGCGVVVLMRLEDALAQGRRVYAVLRGWGISSDGGGGMTRPEVEGQKLALRRAYARAGFGIETVGFFEGHGTGTVVGDATELEALNALRRESAGGRSLPRAGIGSVKANIGHTKAAAGLAGLIKATLAVHARLVPPTTGCSDPHEHLTAPDTTLRAAPRCESWPMDRPPRAGVSSMGFGGINAHVVVASADDAVAIKPRRGTKRRISAREAALSATPQDAELFVFAAQSAAELRSALRPLAHIARDLSRAELADAAAWLSRAAPRGRWRAAVVASTPAELVDKLDHLVKRIEAGDGQEEINVAEGVFLAARDVPPRIGFLFPGQASPTNRTGEAWRRRFAVVDELYARLALPPGGDDADTGVAQPGIIAACAAGLRVLALLGVEADAAVGHSLGELAALHWAGAFDESDLLELARARGAAFAALPAGQGAMAAVGGAAQRVAALLPDGAVVAGLNGPELTVVSGAAADVDETMRRAAAAGMRCTRLRVSHAFHSPRVADAALGLSAALARVQWRSIERAVISTVSGVEVRDVAEARELLLRQVTAPVRFHDALARMQDGMDLLIEVGPGRVLSGLAADAPVANRCPAVALDANGASLGGLLAAVGAAYCLGADVRHEALFEGRALRGFDPARRPRFLASPCEAAPPDHWESADAPAKPDVGTGDSHAAAPSRGDEAAPGSVANANVPAVAAPPSAFETVRRLVAAKAELPVDSVRGEDRLLADLHLNSIVVGRIVVEASRALGLPGPTAPTEFATATVAQVAEALAALAATQAGGAAPRTADRFPPGLETWVRPFTTRWVERPRPATRGAVANDSNAAGEWRMFTTATSAFTERLRAALANAPGRGVALAIPERVDERHVETLLSAAQAAANDPAVRRFLLIQSEAGAASLVRTLRMEVPRLSTLAAEAPFEHAGCVEWVLDELAALEGHVEVRFDESGRRSEPVLCPLPADEDTRAPVLGPDDVMLVTGGGKGLAAECALAAARDRGVSLALLGRAHPAKDAELHANLRRFAQAGVRHRYVVADVTDAHAVRRAVGEAVAALGPVTAVLHGAGRNEPRLLNALTVGDFQRTVAPKLLGLRNVLAALEPARVRQVVAFGSVIARTGMAGEADYAVANEWLAREVSEWTAANRHARGLTLEWSIWSGVGMGERLGRVEALAQQGIAPIAPDEGIRLFRELTSRELPVTSVVVSGRLGDVPTVRFEAPPPPFLRFIGETRVHYPGVEIVAEAELSRTSDPYVEDHVFHGERLFPAVVGLEALAQAAVALAGGSVAGFERVTFARPIVVPAEGATRVRIVALERGAGRVEAAIRCADTDFQVDHFRAVVRLRPGAPCGPDEPARLAEFDVPPAERPELKTDEELYGRLLFHTGVFRRVSGYLQLRARECAAEIAPVGESRWFGPYEPPELLLSDPAARDAAIHAIQACIPHATILPIGVERIDLLAAGYEGARRASAREVGRDGDRYVYDLEVTDVEGRLLERWTGLQLRAMDRGAAPDEWNATLLAVYLERRLAELGIADVRVGIASGRSGMAADPPAPPRANGTNGHREGARDRRGRSDAAIQSLTGEVTVLRRPDGKPAGGSGRHLSAAHAGPLTLAVAGAGALACDVEPVAARPNGDWRELLGDTRFRLAQRVAAEAGEALETAATRVWTLIESLKKVGACPDAALTLREAGRDGWAAFSVGRFLAASYVTRLRGGVPHAIAMVGESGDARL